MRDYPGLYMWAQSNQRVLISVRQENQSQKRRGEDGSKGQRERERGRKDREDATLLTFKEEESTS